MNDDENTVVGQNSAVHFGGVDAPLPDWRKADTDADDDPDDEELDETPADVLMILGFDPKELSD